MSDFTGTIAAQRHTTGTAEGRCLGVLALGILLGGAPALATAAEREAGAPAWTGTLSSEATTTATSRLALVRPAAVLTVTTLADVVDPGDGKLSLREAVAAANATPALDAIRFAPSLEGQTLVLTGGQLTIDQDLTINGASGTPGSQVTIDANRASRVLTITGGQTDVKLNHLVITNGRSFGEDGGGIFLGSRASLTLADCVVASNDTIGKYLFYADGGGIFADTGARVTLERTTVTGNNGGVAYYSGGNGGGIAAAGANQLTIRSSTIADNLAHSGGGLSILAGGTATIEKSMFTENIGQAARGGSAGGLHIVDSTVAISRSTVARNVSGYGGGISFSGSQLQLLESTIASNTAISRYGTGYGGGILGSSVTAGSLFVRNSTITGNRAGAPGNHGEGGGIQIRNGSLDIANSIVAGNIIEEASYGPDISGTITFSNGHSVFGSDVTGNIAGDREKVPASALFAAIDPKTGGGKLSARGVVPLKLSLANPALSGGDPLAAGATGQLAVNPRPLPAGSLPDIGAAEADQPLSTSPTINNDVLTGSAAANNLSGLAGNDLLRGLGGNDTIHAGPGSDLLDGGPGNNRLNGGTGIDLARFAFSPAAVIVDLSGTSDIAKRGGETDTLTDIEGAIGSSKNDTFRGDAFNNEFQGRLGKDTMTGGGGRDTWDFNLVTDSPPGATRDVVRDFVPGQDVLDLAGIDADSTVPGDQSFRWVAKATLTGAAQLGYFVSGGMTIVRASTDADAAAEVEIQLTGAKTLTAVDFRL